MTAPLISVIVPVYNEKPNIEPTAREVIAAFEQVVSEMEIIFVDEIYPVLEKFMKDYCIKHFGGKNVSKFSPIGVYNEFNHNRIHHRQNIVILKNEIRKYLRIDEKW